MDPILLLIDIDGTLLHTDGAGKRAMEGAFQEIFGPGPGVADIDMRGMLDPMIVRVALEKRGASGDLSPEVWTAFAAAYLARLRVECTRRETWRVTPGTRAFLTSAPPAVRFGLVTGNMIGGAELKLGSVGLMRFFPAGGFGEDGQDREAVARAARDRCAAHYGLDFTPERTAVIGDTPLDVACGKAIGARTIGITSGFASTESLEQAGADRVATDFTELLDPDRKRDRYLFWPLNPS